MGMASRNKPGWGVETDIKMKLRGEPDALPKFLDRLEEVCQEMGIQLLRP